MRNEQTAIVASVKEILGVVRALWEDDWIITLPDTDKEVVSGLLDGLVVGI
jgi:hypothetical protein